MELSEEQRGVVAGWIREGKSLAEVQKGLESEFSLRLTYMDVRFLVDDLDLELTSTGPQFDDPKAVEAQAVAPAGGVSVTLDKVSRPDALVSGQVTFSDGVNAQWHLDQMGRLALNPMQADYRPSETDLEAFQRELRSAVEKSGLF
jgi:hypothetical protein